MAQISITTTVFLSILVLLAATMKGSHAVNYTVTNTATGTLGGARFTRDLGVEYSKHIADAATNFIWRLLQEDCPDDRKTLQNVSLFVDNSTDGYAAYTSDGEIHLSAEYMQVYSGDLKVEITGILFHEMTHIWQWNGNGETPEGLIEGIADYVRLKAGYAPSHWVKPGQGDRWDQGYDVTAFFLDYCNSLCKGFVAKLNKKMRNGYCDTYFVDLLGETVDQLWKNYKAKYDE